MFQQTIIIGHVGKPAEMRYTPAGKAVTSFSVATSKKWTNANGEQQEKTTWFRVTCWGKLAEVAAQYVTKSTKIMVEGEIDASAWTDKEGNPKASLELTARQFKFLSSKGESNGVEGQQDEKHDSSSRLGREWDFNDEAPF